MRPWLRRMITRSIAVIPAALTIYFAGDQSTFGLLLLSQAILSMQLPFAIVPLVHFTNDRARMGSFANATWVRLLAWLTAAIVIGLNGWLAVQSIGSWLDASGRWRPLIWAIVVPLAAALSLMLLWITFEPLITSTRRRGRAAVSLPETAGAAQEAVPV